MKTFLLVLLLFAAPAIAADVEPPPLAARAALLKAALAVEAARAAIQVAADAQGAAAPAARAGAIAPAAPVTPGSAIATTPVAPGSVAAPVPVAPGSTVTAAPTDAAPTVPSATITVVPAGADRVSADFAPILQAVISGVAAIIAAAFTALIALYMPKAIAAVESHTKIQLTQQQHDAVMEAATTGAGIIETMIHQGALKLEQVTINNPAVLEQAALAVDRVPVAAAAMKKTIPSMAQSIVGLADTAPKSLVVASVAQATPVAIPTKPVINVVQAPPAGAKYDPRPDLAATVQNIPPTWPS